MEDSQKHHAEQKKPGSHRGQFSFFKILGKVKLKGVTESLLVFTYSRGSKDIREHLGTVKIFRLESGDGK